MTDTVDQSAFAAALLNPEREISLSGRFSVYRNNVTVALCEAMAVSFPVIEKLIGPTNFRNLANIYIRQHPPRSPLMMFYGADFPEFLEAFNPLSHLGYLGDVARLECAMRRAYHAADPMFCTPCPTEKLAALPVGVLEGIRFQFAPATQVLKSNWPIYDIWRFNTAENAPQPTSQAQSVLITRPQYDVELTTISPDEAKCADALLNGARLGEAVALTSQENFDISNLLTFFLRNEALTDIGE